jgi:hypothetical protein
MNREQVEDIIKSLENRGYEVRFKTYTGNSVSFQCNNHVFVIDYSSTRPVVGVGIRLKAHSTFNQKDVDWLNSVTDYWEIHKYCISFSFVAESKQKLENVLSHCVEYF